MTTLGKINDAELSSQVKEKSTHDKNKAFSEGNPTTKRRYIKGSRPARVTRISIESQQVEGETLIKPRLKRGLRISKAPTEDSHVGKPLIITSAHHAVAIHIPGARAIIALLDGSKTCNQISAELDAPLESVESVINELKIAEFLDLKTSKIKLHNRFQSPIAERAAHTEDQTHDASYRQLQSRMSSELCETTWVSGVIDDGVELLSSRQNFGVEIYGDSRLATLIYAALLASGVTNTRFSLSSRRNIHTIGDRDMGTGILRNTDFGLSFASRTEELAREWSLFPTPSKNVKGTIASPIPERNLRVIVGDYSQELIAQLMRDRHDHLFVGEVVAGASYLGPLVKPGMTPCSACLDLCTFERFGVEKFLPLTSDSEEIPVALAFQIAGSAVHAIVQLIDTGTSEFIGAQMSLDYASPIRKEPMKIARHPNCSCRWKFMKGDSQSTICDEHIEENHPQGTIALNFSQEL